MTGELTFVASRASLRLSPVMSAALNFPFLVVVGQDGGADLLLQVEDFGGDVVENSCHDAAPCFYRGGGPTHYHRLFTAIIRPLGVAK